MREGFVHVVSRHTTTALTINEDEPRLVDDVRQFLARLAPPTMPYLHNDLHMREAPEGWPGGWEAWAKQVRHGGAAAPAQAATPVQIEPSSIANAGARQRAQPPPLDGAREHGDDPCA